MSPRVFLCSKVGLWRGDWNMEAPTTRVNESTDKFKAEGVFRKWGLLRGGGPWLCSLFFLLPPSFSLGALLSGCHEWAAFLLQVLSPQSFLVAWNCELNKSLLQQWGADQYSVLFYLSVITVVSKRFVKFLNARVLGIYIRTLRNIVDEWEKLD